MKQFSCMGYIFLGDVKGILILLLKKVVLPISKQELNHLTLMHF